MRGVGNIGPLLAIHVCAPADAITSCLFSTAADFLMFGSKSTKEVRVDCNAYDHLFLILCHPYIISHNDVIHNTPYNPISNRFMPLR